VTVPLFVTDGRGRRVPGLAQSDFELRDDGRRVEPVYFAAGAEHVSMLFLLDASGSTRDIIVEQRETDLADDLAGQYVLGYHASAADPRPGFRRVEVRLNTPDKRGLRVRQLRDGYESEQ
jgi:hypothetical protein